jgi:mannuronan 5-epimerase
LKIFVFVATYQLIIGLNPTFGSSVVSENNDCIQYDNKERIITISCVNPVHLSDLNNKLQNQEVLERQGVGLNESWILNAGITIEAGSTFVIDSTDTNWLKIIADGKHAYPITVLGSLVIDSVKITSWNPKTQDYAKFKKDLRPVTEDQITDIDKMLRPYIKIEDETTGTTNVTNSELAYLGYDCEAGCSGLSYYGSNGTSIIKNNELHHNRFGFYSAGGAGNIILENNYVHHNFMYGFDPHTGTHDMLIKNNTLHDHGAQGIICSLDCHNITIEGNKVSRSDGSGIMFSRNMSGSVARNNVVHDESKCIFLSQSHNNEVYNNSVSNCARQGIYLYHNSFENKIYHNTIGNSTENILVSDDSKDNEITSNTIIGQKENETQQDNG